MLVRKTELKRKNKTRSPHLKSTIFHKSKKQISMDHLDGERPPLKHKEKVTLDKRLSQIDHT